MSFISFECRFCLKRIQANEKMAAIDEEIRNQFIDLTQTKLDLIEGLSNVVCEICLRSVQLSYAVKLQFAENQRILYTEIEDIQNKAQCDESSLHEEPLDDDQDIPDPLGESAKSTESIPEPVNEFSKSVNDRLESEKGTPKPRVKRQRKSSYEETCESPSNSFCEVEMSSFMAIEPEISIKEEQFDEDEIQFHNRMFGQFNFTGNSLSESQDNKQNDSDDPTNMLEEMKVKTDHQDIQQTPTETKKVRKKRVPKEKNLDKSLEPQIFSCPYCPNTYKSSVHLKRHIDVSHKKQKFHCFIPECTKVYSRRDKLRNHIFEKHGGLNAEEFADTMEKVKTMIPIYGFEI